MICMKKMIKIFVDLSVILTVSLSFSQQDSNSYWQQRELGIIQQSNITESEAVVSNITYIQQIGNQNYSNVNLQSNHSNFRVYQNGYNNEVDITKSAYTINELVVQNGDNNSIYERSYYSNVVNSQVIQTGNNNEYLSMGSNSISDNLKINIRGNNKTVIVLNR